MKNNWDEKIDNKIKEIKEGDNIYSTGKVIKVSNYIIEASGLNDISFYEEVNINNIARGYVLSILSNKVLISLVEVNGEIKTGDLVYGLKKEFKCLFSLDSVGKVIDIFGNDLIAGKRFDKLIELPIEGPQVSIMDRGLVKREFLTGITGIDLIYPIGKGQRQLIIGDKKTGKTQILLDTIANQKNKNVICIYVAIGKTKKEVKRVFTKLTEKQTNSYTLIVAAFNDDPVPLIKLTPYVALSIAQEYMMEGFDVLVCIDDLKTHADACREMALIAEKNTGRDAYPADIFYIHSRLLEKGCQYENGASITILPTVQTKGGDITDYISTNIISITDGQIVLSEKLFKKGQKPAINFGLSVSRLGGAVQSPDVKKVGAVVRREVLSYLETSDVYQLVNVESLSDELQSKIFKGQKLLGLLNQRKFSPMSQEKLIADFGYVAGLGDSKVVDELIKDIELTKRIESDEKPEKIKEIKVSTAVDESLVEHAPKREGPKEDFTKKDYFARPSDFSEKSYSSTDIADSGITYVNMDEDQKNEEFSYVVKQDSSILNPEATPSAPTQEVPVTPPPEAPVQESVPAQPETSAPVTEMPSTTDTTNNQNTQQ